MTQAASSKQHISAGRGEHNHSTAEVARECFVPSSVCVRLYRPNRQTKRGRDTCPCLEELPLPQRKQHTIISRTEKAKANQSHQRTSQSVVRLRQGSNMIMMFKRNCMFARPVRPTAELKENENVRLLSRRNRCTFESNCTSQRQILWMKMMEV